MVANPPCAKHLDQNQARAHQGHNAHSSLIELWATQHSRCSPVFCHEWHGFCCILSPFSLPTVVTRSRGSCSTDMSISACLRTVTRTEGYTSTSPDCVPSSSSSRSASSCTAAATARGAAEPDSTGDALICTWK